MTDLTISIKKEKKEAGSTSGNPISDQSYSLETFVRNGEYN